MKENYFHVSSVRRDKDSLLEAGETQIRKLYKIA